MSVTQPLDATFAALADPTRRAILARLALGEASVRQLAEPFEMTQPAVSKHLKVLERAELGQFLQRQRYRLLQLRVVTLADCLRILLHNVVRLHAVILHVPLSLRREERYQSDPSD